MSDAKTKSSTGGRVLLVLRILFTVCLAGSVIFIFRNSAQIGSISSLRSEAVTAWLNRVMVDKIGLSIQFTEGQVRKLAHVAEFTLLGFWLMMTLRVYTKRLIAHISWPLFFGLLIPVCDETLQLFIPGRAGQVRDIVIDFAGVCLGIGCALMILLIFRAFWKGLFEREEEYYFVVGED